MKHTAEITWYARGDEGDTTYMESLSTRNEAVDYLKHWSSGYGSCRMWLDGKEISKSDLFANDNQPKTESQIMAEVNNRIIEIFGGQS